MAVVPEVHYVISPYCNWCAVVGIKTLYIYIYI
jgi:protein-disulfide isomerase-like protein with CxxC motif